MALLIDGYNLLHASGVVARGFGPGGLARSRQALLNVLAASIPPDELARTTVVFDADKSLRHLPRSTSHQGIQVLFARDHESADDMIEELIHASSAPRGLVVVSSDHRLQRAARRRRAQAVGSRAWFTDLMRQRRDRLTPDANDPSKPTGPLSDAEVRYWLEQFGTSDADDRDEKFNLGQ